MWNTALVVLLVILFLYVVWPKKLIDKSSNSSTQQLDVANSGQTVEDVNVTDSTEETPPQLTQPVIPSEDKSESIETMRSFRSHVGRSDHSRWASARTDPGFH